MFDYNYNYTRNISTPTSVWFFLPVWVFLPRYDCRRLFKSLNLANISSLDCGFSSLPESTRHPLITLIHKFSLSDWIYTWSHWLIHHRAHTHTLTHTNQIHTLTNIHTQTLPHTKQTHKLNKQTYAQCAYVCLFSLCVAHSHTHIK